TAKPKHFSDDFLLTTLGAMFEKPDAHAQIWKNQRSVHGQAKVKSWKLLESCDSLSPHVISAAKLSILNPNEFDLWKIRIEQYFMMTDYSLWEVILNGNSHVPTRVVEGVLQLVAPTTAEQKLARKNKLKRNKVDLEEQSLDDLLNSLKIYEAEVKHSSSTGTITQNLAFVSSSNTESTSKSVSAPANVYAICDKMPVTFLHNFDSLSNAVIYSFFASQSTNPQLDKEDLKQIDAEILKLMDLHLWVLICLKWSVMTATGRDILLGSIGSYDWSYQAEEELANYALMAFSSSSSSSDTEVFTRAMFDYDDYLSSESDCENLPPTSVYDRFQPSGGYHIVPLPYTGTFMPPKPDLVFHTVFTAVETNHPTFNVQLSPTKPDQDFFVQSSEQVKSPRHSVKHVKTTIPATTPNPASLKHASSGKKRNTKACFVYKSMDHLINDYDYHAKKMAQPTPRNHAHRVLSQSKPVTITAVRPISAAVPKFRTSNLPPTVTVVKAPVGNLQHALKDKGVIDSGCSWHMTGNMSYLSDFEEFNGGYVAFGGNPKGGKIYEKGKIRIGLENLLSLKVKIIRCDNGTEFKNANLNQLCGLKGIKWEFSVPRTPQQNSIAERKNRTLIEAARTLLADSLLPIPFWVEAVNNACYVQNRVLVTKPHNKTPYELLHGRLPSIGFMRPFGCPVTILNTLDPLGKFQRKETLHVNFMENKPNVVGSGPAWLFDIDSLSQTMNYHPVLAENQTNSNAGFQDLEKAGEEGTQTYVLFPVLSDGSTNPKNNKDTHTSGNKHNDDIQKSVSPDIHSSSCGDQAREQGDKAMNKDKENKPNVAGSDPTWLIDIDSLTWTMNYQPVTARNQTNPNADAAFDGKEYDFDAKKPESEVNVSPSSNAQSRKQDHKTQKKARGKSHVESFAGYRDLRAEFEDCSKNSCNEVNATGSIVPTVGQNSPNSTLVLMNWRTLPILMMKIILNNDGDAAFDGKEYDFDAKKPESEVNVSPSSNAQSRKQDDKTKKKARGKSHVESFAGYRDLRAEFEDCSKNSCNEVNAISSIVPTVGQNSPNSTLVLMNWRTLPILMMKIILEEPKRVHQAIEDPSWIEAMQEELLQFKMQKVWVLVDLPHGKRAIRTKWGYKNKKDEIGSVVRNKARLVAQGHTQEEDDIIFGATNKDLCKSFEKLMQDKFQMSSMEELTFFLGLLVKQKKDEIFISQDKYVAEILRKFGLTEGKSASTPIDTEEPLLKDPNGEDVDVHTYRLISWQCKKQTVVATSSTEAEYVADASCCAHVQIYVDDIIFGATNKDMCKSFEKLMQDKFQMSSMGELTFFLGLLVKQKKDEIFISQDKYVAEILRKFGLTEGKSASTPTNIEEPLLKDPDGEDVDVHTYRSMIG
nr:hypothetical protein [Tanacetum cinerariifolium]